MEVKRAKDDLQELERGGVVQGHTPIETHLELYLIQIVLVIVLCGILGRIVKKWNQPRVIAEVIAGVLLGPSAFGAIPSFSRTLFPEESLEALTLTAHLGLILFLLIVGLELDPGLLRSNAKKAGILSLTGQGVTWLLSLGVSRAMITWMDDVESSTSFVLFIGVSLSVTAFPVLSRILGENSLLNTNVGSLVISAASVDEACVWCLLALVVSTVNAGSPLDAFYVFLLLFFFVVVMLTLVRPALLFVVRRISGDDSGPPARGVVILCLLLTLVSAWITDIIGIDAIFGAFVAGIIVPREHSLHVRIVELVQDVVSVLLLPLYFAVSGLKTDLTLLNDATSWGLCLLTICAACVGKIGGGSVVARLFGMTNRESLAVGVLMNTRGLVELIILNIGLDAGVLTEEVMAIMVVMALVTTFLTAPLSSAVYPLKYHTVPDRKRRRRASEESAAMKHSLARTLSSIPELGAFAQERLTLMVLVTNPSALDAVTRIARLFSGNRPIAKNPVGDELVVHALRLVENTDRFSSDMRALEKGETLNKDSLAGILQGFLGLLRIKVMTHISVGTPTDFCQDVTRLSDEHGVSTVVFPWDVGTTHPSTQLTRVERLMESTQSQFVVAFNCRTASAGLSLLVPFFGGDDDTAALLLALAILERDTSAELVVLSFLEPENPPTGASAAGRKPSALGQNAGTEAADGSRHERNGSILNLFSNTTPAEAEDLETGGAATATAAAQPAPTAAAAAAAALPSNAAASNVAGRDGRWFGGAGKGNDSGDCSGKGGGGALDKSWSSRELVRRAQALPRVRVTPAWSLNAALGAASSSTSSSPASSAAATIVQQVASAEAVGLVLCGCAGSAPLTSLGQQQQWREAAAGGGGLPGAGSNAPLPSGGATTVHGKWPSRGVPSIIGSSVSRHGPSSLSLMTRSWHGKSRHHHHHGRGGRVRQAAAAAAASGGGGAGSPPRRSGLASAVNMVINSALWDMIGDVAACLTRSEAAPAVFAVRASRSVPSAMG